MSDRVVVIVGETPSLGRSIGDLLATEGIPCRVVSDLTTDELESWRVGRAPVVLVACNEVYCRTARRWDRGELPGASLVVVGARDPELRNVRGAQIVPLPLRREPFVALVRDLIADPSSRVG